MKKLVITSILVIITLLNLKADNEKEIRAEIKHITVYSDRAQISHETNVIILPGRSVFKLTGLSPYIDVQSIQVKGYGEFMILSVNHQNNFLQNLADSPEVKSIRSQIEVLQTKSEDEKAAISVLEERKAFLAANRAMLIKETTFTIDQVKNLMDLYTSSMEQITLSILKKNRLIKDYEKQISLLQQQISARLGKQQLPSGEISVTLTSDKQISGKLTFSYVVNNAGWFPSYDIRVDDINKPVSIFYKANVFQNSGVEWKDVNLSFSNATPWVAGDVPVLHPWFIDFYNPVIMIQGRKSLAVNKSQAPAMMEMAVSEKKDAAKEMEALPVAVEKRVGEATISFDIAVPYTIVSDGKVQTIEIQRITTPAEYKYVTIPKISQLAYLTANITDWAKQSLLGGEATLYFENSFVGKTYLNVNQLTDTLAISLGNDNSILVKREKRKDFTSRKMIGTNKMETFSFLITFRNNKATPIRLSVNDQIPVSSNSGILVDPVELSGGKHNPETGEIKWDLELKTLETKQLILTYSVKYPKDKNVILE
jgi:uncharacterized protein (TIGR02231 family)